MAKPKVESAELVDILQITRSRTLAYIVGTSGLICNRMSQKARGQILMPRKKSAVERVQSLKHDPLLEYREAPYRMPEPTAPTELAALATWFKQAMMNAALDMPGAKKAQIGRHVRVLGERVPLFGIPQLFMSIVRSADINKTPDIRSRAILPQWACTIEIEYTASLFSGEGILNLLASAGQTIGVGDWRTQKGSGDYGSFEVVNPDDPRLLQVQTMGRELQLFALDSPTCYDQETEELWSWFQSEHRARTQRGLAAGMTLPSNAPVSMTMAPNGRG